MNEQLVPRTSNPSDAPLERVRWLLQTQFIRGSGLTDLQAIIVQAAMHEIERLQKQLDTEDKAHTSTIEERDRVEAYADQLAEMIGVFCEVDVGEHSSENCPWEEAIEAMRVAIGNKAHGNETCDALDAARYRFLHQPGNAIVYAKDRNAWGEGASGWVRWETSEQLDAAVDAARAHALKANLVPEPVLCSDCPPIGYPTHKTRCVKCPRLAQNGNPQA